MSERGLWDRIFRRGMVVMERSAHDSDGVVLTAATHPPDPLEGIAVVPEDLSPNVLELTEIDVAMPEETEVALRKSIDKWRAIVAGTGTDDGVENCALCKRFHSHHSENRRADGTCCVGCPVMAATKQTVCSGSPYDVYTAHAAGCALEDTGTCDECLRLARAELNFLVGLLPQSEKETA